MQVTDSHATVQEKSPLLPEYFAGTDGLHYRRVRAAPGKFFVYNTMQEATHDEAHLLAYRPSEGEKGCVNTDVASRQYQKISTLEHELIDTSSTDDTEETEQPLIMGMTDEELAASGNIDFTQDDATNESQNEASEAREETAYQQRMGLLSDKADSLLSRLLNKEQALSDAATRSVVFSPPLISRNDVGIIGRGTVNIIQGAFGSHKSRLAELIASLMLTRSDSNDAQFLGFKRAMLERFCVCYIDTERNQREELPFAIQGIKQRAGYALDAKPTDFRFTSIKGENRQGRFAAIETFISHVREQTQLHLFCLIDVVTDAIGDFNDPKESMKLFDFLGNICDNYDTTFLLVIHQNPGTEKARGHTGTEAANKASTALQIGFEKDANGNETELIRMRYIKLRRGKRPEPLYLQFNKETNGLVLADPSLIADRQNQRNHKADSEAITERLLDLLAKGPRPKNEIWSALEEDFKASNATIRVRLKSIMDDQPDMFNEHGKAVRLSEETQGRSQYFKLAPIE